MVKEIRQIVQGPRAGPMISALGASINPLLLSASHDHYALPLYTSFITSL